MSSPPKNSTNSSPRPAYLSGATNYNTLNPNISGELMGDSRNNLVHSSEGFFNKGIGFESEPNTSSRYNTGIIEKKIIQTDEHGYLALDKPPQEGTTRARKFWVFLSYLFTFLVPGFVLGWFGFKQKEQKQAWREKITLCIFIVFSWIVLLFVIIGLGLILCPKQHVWSIDELSGHNVDKDAYISIRGTVYDISKFIKQNHGVSPFPTADQMLLFAGNEVNYSFPLAIKTACPQLFDENVDTNNSLYLSYDITQMPDGYQNWFQHKVAPSKVYKHMSDTNFYFDDVLPTMNKYKKGSIVWKYKQVNDWHTDYGMYWRVINGEVFNLADYFYTINNPISQTQPAYNFLDPKIVSLFDDSGSLGTDLSAQWKLLNIDQDTLNKNYNCMKNLFFVGKVDTRQSLKCLFTNYLLLAFASILVFVIFIKFLAALQFGSKNVPQKQNKFVLCVVPCYTENENSINRTINSLASLDYDDKRKLIFVVCDGNIVGSGNDRPTPRIVLDTLGVDPDYDPPLRDYLAISEGPLEHNKAKVYSGLYDFEGHSVPFVVVVKVGNMFELKKPGNRGKRDSQLLVMRFLSKAFFGLPMTPLDLELHHHLSHIIGIHPTLFEFMFQVDADTQVYPDSLSRLVSSCTSDGNIVGICGETRLSNEKSTWVTMIQVYEYFISHNMAKAFESLFGTVTCLPGCFCMYRLYDMNKKPILLSPKIIIPYSEKRVDTLHKKNLLSLGEDRYLTTLMLKYFPSGTLRYIRDARCYTIAPEKWSVFISQRRRWINSTVHNLFELVLIQDLCGFCCFSMRFVVILDLFGTLTIPTVMIYMGYIVFIAISKLADVGYISLIIIAAVYGLQAIIYIMRREWQHIGWMLAYILFFPLWSFILPIYSFWHFDDFSWGNTRTIQEDKDAAKSSDKTDFENEMTEFDPKSIPLMLWPEYEAQLVSQGVLNLPPENMNPPESRAGSRTGSRAGSQVGSRAGTSMMRQQPVLRSLTPALNRQSHITTNSAQPFIPAGPVSAVSGMNFSPQQIYNAGQNIPPNSLGPQNRVQSYYSNAPPNVYQQPVNRNSGQFNRFSTVSTGIPPQQQQYMGGMGPQMMNNGMMVSGVQQVPSNISSSDNNINRNTIVDGLSYFNNAGQPTDPQQQYTQQFEMGLIGAQNNQVLMPSEEQVVEVIRSILSSNDLDNLSKKTIREQLSLYFGVDMTPYKQFIRKLTANEIVLSDPIFIGPAGTVCIHITRENIIFLCVLTEEESPISILEFLEQLVTTITFYIKKLNETNIKENFVTVYELVCEMVDEGYIVVTDASMLQSIVPVPNLITGIIESVSGLDLGRGIITPKLDHSVWKFTGGRDLLDNFGSTKNSLVDSKNRLVVESESQEISSQVLPWRNNLSKEFGTDGISYLNNEIFFDVVEKLSYTVDTNNNTSNFHIDGDINVNSKLSGMPIIKLALNKPGLIDDISFHMCTKLLTFQTNKTINFTPPDGKFKLASYSLKNDMIPFDSHTIPINLVVKRVFENIIPTTNIQNRIDLKREENEIKDERNSPPNSQKSIVQGFEVYLTPNFSFCSLLSNVKLKIPLPKSAYNIEVKTSLGSYNVDSKGMFVEWKIKDIKKDTTIETRNGNSKKLAIKYFVFLENVLDFDSTITVDFQMFGVSLSGLRIEKMDIINLNKKVYKGAKYETSAGIVQFRF
ncbi:hypothetical protein BB559_001769 [Furculomyces boomerangus]|uniref:chitin synthase n=1 Tax=Furculomyces boomerangus TaxID=61424 RepID=A0A2T9Z0L0_9FUNG|nr:hypothetical protein BB559_001769 [Furculomyces boomerangus]